MLKVRKLCCTLIVAIHDVGHKRSSATLWPDRAHAGVRLWRQNGARRCPSSPLLRQVAHTFCDGRWGTVSGAFTQHQSIVRTVTTYSSALLPQECTPMTSLECTLAARVHGYVVTVAVSGVRVHCNVRRRWAWTCCKVDSWMVCNHRSISSL